MRNAVVVAVVVMALAPLALASSPVAADVKTGFADVADDDIMAAPISWLRVSGITRGCNPPVNTSFCPDRPVTRGEMAAFLARAMDLDQVGGQNAFVDDDDSVFAADIDQLAALGITRGCNPPANDRFCPNHQVTRGQMAALMARAFELPQSEAQEPFTDTGGSVFAADIAKLASAGITLGCNPPSNDRFCPDDEVTREQMATFIWRAFDRPPPGEPSRLVAAGDISRCELSTDEATADLLDDLFADRNGVVAALGDTVYNTGTPEEYRDCYEPSWGRHRFRTFPAVGNHEYGTTNAAGYFAYFGEAAGNPESGWYSYPLGQWQVIVLNSNCGEIGGCRAGSDQQSWLEQELQSSDALCTLAYMHHPRFSSGVHGDDDDLDDLWSTLEAHSVELVLAGHDHNYERFAPLHADGTLAGPHGVQSFVIGTGGTWLRSTDGARAGSEVLIDDHHGVLSLDLSSDSYEWRFIDTAGSILDEGMRTCS
jgi:hypothetical protein